MADTKISALTAATTPLAGTEVLPIVQSGVTKQVSVANLTAGRAVSADSLTLTGSPLPATSGGTGQSSFAVGDLLYASTTTALSKLADVATGNALISGGVGVAPSWGKIGLTTHISGTLAVGNGGTGLSSVAQGDLLYGSAANTLSALAKNTTASRYLSNSGTSNNPAWAQIDLTNGVTGTLPVGNGGTGNTTGAATSVKSNATTGVMQIVGPAAASTRVMTIPDADFTVARTDVAQTFNGGTQIFDWAQGVADEKVLRIQNSQGSQLTKADFGFYSSVFGIQARNIAETVNQPLALQPQGGGVTIGGTTDAGTGNLLMATGNITQGTAAKGINFTANSAAAGKTSQLLNWYEEGTFTPAYQTSNNNITFTAGTNVNGKYTRIGNMVFFSLMVRGNITGGTGNLQITGLPYAAVTVNSAGVPASISANYNWTSSPGGQPLVAGSLIALGSLGATDWTATAVGASKSGSNSYNEVIVSGCYQVS